MARRPAAGRNRGRSNRVAGRFDRDAALDRWTPEMMADRVERSYGEVRQVHSRTSILQRLLTHEAYHGGELAIALGSHHLDPTYIWRADDPLNS